MSALDPAVLDEHRTLGDDFIATFLGLVTDSLRKGAAAATADRHTDPEAVGNAAHSIKNSAANVGARRLQELAARVEREAYSPDAPLLIDEMCQEIDVVINELAVLQ